MSIVLFAMIGNMLEAGAVYWICFTIYAIFRIIKIGVDLGKELK